MSTENLKVVITGDASDLDKASDRATKSLSEIENSAKSLGLSMADLKSKLASYKFLQEQTTDPKLFQKYGQQVTRWQGEIDKRMGTLAGSSKQANFAMISLSQGLGDLPYGFSAIANNIQQTVQAFGYLQKSSGGTKGALKALGGTLAGPTGLFLGFSVVTAIMTTLIQKYGSLSNAAKQLFGHLTDQEKAQERLNKAIEDGAKSISGSLTSLFQVQTYVDLAAKGYISANNAVNKFNKVLGESFGKVNSLKEAQDKLTESSNKYIQATVYNTVASKLLGQASDEIVKNYQIQAKTNEQAASSLDKVSNFIQLIFTGGNKSGKNIFNAFTKDLDKMNEASGAAQKRLSQLTTQNDLEKLFKDVKKYSEQAATSFKGLFNEKEIKSSGKTIKSVLKDLAESLKGIDLKRNTGELGYLDVASEKIKAYTKALQDLGKLGAKPTSKEIAEITKQINILKGELVKAIPTTLKEKQLLEVQKGNNAQDIFQPQPIVPKYINPNPPNLNGYKEPKKQIDPFLDSLNKAGIISDQVFSSMNEKLNQNVGAANVLAGAFNNIFSAIQSGGDPFKALLQSVEQLIIQLTIAIATVALLNAIPGGSAVLKVLDLAGAATSFASGGFIPSPTLAVVGDAPGGEWVLNQKQMGALLNGAGNNKGVSVSGELRLRGNDLVAAIKRTNDSNSRVN